MSKDLKAGDIIGIYEVLGESNTRTNDGHKQLHVKCIVCGIEKDVRPNRLGAIVCNHKRKIDPKLCECCGKVIPYNSSTKAADYKLRRFCSASCAAKITNHRAHSDASKSKASQTLLLKYNDVNSNLYQSKLKAKEVYASSVRRLKNASKYYINDFIEGQDYVVCPYCNMRFRQIQISHLKLHNKTFEDLYVEFGNDYKTISNITYEKKVKVGKEVQQKLIDAGKHKSWQSRKITSFAERFWINVLNNYDITYIREFPIKHENSNYFLDFKLERHNKLIDLEIDGKQHTYEERAISDKIRDDYLKSLGYIVYRISWNDLKTDAGKQEMQQKINEFLNFYFAL